jgi:hypothetical protein
MVVENAVGALADCQMFAPDFLLAAALLEASIEVGGFGSSCFLQASTT